MRWQAERTALDARIRAAMLEVKREPMNTVISEEKKKEVIDLTLG